MDLLKRNPENHDYYRQLEAARAAESPEVLYMDLLKRNPENHDYYRQLEAARAAESPEAKLAIYTEYQEKFPRAQAPKRLPLNFLSGGELESRLSTYVRAALRKGVPPLFVDLRPLYENPEFAELIHKMMTVLFDNQLNFGSFDSDEAKVQEPPTSLLWTYYYLAQHFD